MSIKTIVIECQACRNWEEMSADDPRHKSQSFKHVHSFNASTHSTAPEQLNGLAVYECNCGQLVVSKCVEEADIENDEFQCERCDAILDIDDSIKLTDDIFTDDYLYVCESCHEELKETQRRDEKNGLYAGKEDVAN